MVDSGPVFDMTVADSPDESRREADTNVSEEIQPNQWKSGAEFSLVRGSGFTPFEGVEARSDIVQQAGILIPD